MGWEGGLRERGIYIQIYTYADIQLIHDVVEQK